jgi:cell pole-organizing protein PopZ
MVDMSKEPSMEDILSSIKRIIAEEGEDAVQTLPRRARAEAKVVPVAQAVAAAPEAQPIEEVLELTDEVAVEEAMPAHKTSRAPRAVADQEDASILSVESEVAARHSLSALSSMLVAPKDGEDNTLEGLVRAMLKPMLKDWLDARLPQLVEDMVAKEIARITGR